MSLKGRKGRWRYERVGERVRLELSGRIWRNTGLHPAVASSIVYTGHTGWATTGTLDSYPHFQPVSPAPVLAPKSHIPGKRSVPGQTRMVTSNTPIHSSDLTEEVYSYSYLVYKIPMTPS